MFCESAIVPESGEDALNPWRDTLLGVTHRISINNELMWRGVLQQVCRRLIEEGCRGKAKVAGVKLELNNEWTEWMRSNIETLWGEQVIVADAVLTSIKDGVEF